MSYLDLTAKFETKISEAGYRLRIDAIPTMAWCSSPDGSVEFFNQRWHDYTGLSFEEARGWGWKTVIHPDDLETVIDKWHGLLASGQPARSKRALGGAMGNIAGSSRA